MIVDIKDGKLIRAKGKDGWKVLKGECKRCGKCCKTYIEGCKHIIDETIDGVKVVCCGRQWNKPMNCILYPNSPDDELIEGCGYFWGDE